MKIKVTVTVALLLTATLSTAQLDPVMLGQGHVLDAQNRGYATRARQQRQRVTPRQRAACAPKARFRAREGNTPKVRRLYELCRRIGL